MKSIKSLKFRIMSHARRQFSAEQKLQILQDADQTGFTQTLHKHNLSHSVYQRWKRQFNAGGASLLKPQYHKVDPEVKALLGEKMQGSKRSLATKPLNWNLRPSF